LLAGINKNTVTKTILFGLNESDFNFQKKIREADTYFINATLSYISTIKQYAYK